MYYLGIADLPSKKAHSIQEMKMCEAFAEAGEDVVYLHSHTIGERGAVSWGDVAEYYGLETRFAINTVRTLDGRTGRFTKVGTLSMAGSIAGRVFLDVLAGRLDADDVIYGRNYYPLYFLTELLKLLPASRRPPVVLEYHDPFEKRFIERFFGQVDGVVCITEKLADYTVETHGVGRDRVLVAPDGVTLDPYQRLSKSAARRELGLPENEAIVMYTGHCYDGKGVEDLVRAARDLDATVYVVGGYEDDIQRVKRVAGEPENVVFTGFVDPSSIPVYQVAADVLVAPYDEQSRSFLSPLKLFEYMAAERPIVASDRPVLQEVLTDGDNAVLFPAGDAEALAAELTTVMASPDVRSRLEAAVRKSVEQYTWESRAETILATDWTNRS